MVILIFVAATQFDVAFGNVKSDYLLQHTRFLDYMRKNFSYKHDVFPQWLMNYGLGQSFVILYYYGLYNPFIMLTYLIPIENPVFLLELIFIIITVINSVAMTILLYINGIKVV